MKIEKSTEEKVVFELRKFQQVFCNLKPKQRDGFLIAVGSLKELLKTIEKELTLDNAGFYQQEEER